ncbi:MAG: hypothetical protein Tsb0010_10130 [Parvularculaceae bacterium]
MTTLCSPNRLRRAVLCAASCAALLASGAAGAAAAAWAQPQGDAEARERRIQEMLASERPIAARQSFWIEELTWMEVRDAIADGRTTAIIPTGGIEENGPFLATGKHNYILNATCPVIAEELGNALCAPVVKFVPEGGIEPPTGPMRFPGTFSVRGETYKALLDDIASSLKAHGFTNIVFIGDSGGNQRGMAEIAEELNARWAESGARAHFIRAYYDPGWVATENYTAEELGVAQTRNDGHHDDIWVTAMMAVDDPATIRHAERLDAGLASINGVSIEDLDATIELGRKMIAFRARLTAEAIKEAIGE